MGQPTVKHMPTATPHLAALYSLHVADSRASVFRPSLAWLASPLKISGPTPFSLRLKETSYFNIKTEPDET